MVWEITPARSTFQAFAAEWDRLNDEFYGGHPFFDSRFIGPLLEYFGDGSEQLCIHRSSASVDGAVILRARGLGRWELFVPAQAQIGAVLLREARFLGTLMDRLPGRAWTIDLLKLDPNHCPSWTCLRKPRTILPHALTMAVELDGGFDAYWRSRSRHLAKNIRRYRSRCKEQLGTPTLVTVTDPQQIRQAVMRYGALEAAGWKGRAGTAVSADNLQGKFYEETLCRFAASGQAMVAELHIGKKLAASRLIVLKDRMWVILKTTYDESVAAVAPGRLLLDETLRRAFSEMSSGAVEFYTDATRDQAQWATSLRFIRHHQLYRNELLAAGYGFVRMLRSAFNRRPGQYPAAAELANKPVPMHVGSYDGIGNLSPDALRLFENTARRNIELSADWFANLQATVFAGDPGARYYVAEFNGRPSAILPLRLTRRGPIRQIGSLSNYYTSLYSPILAPESTALDLIPLLEQAERDNGAHVMRFSPMDPESPAYEALLAALRSSGWIPFRFFCFGNWILKVEDSWAEYLKKRSGSLRSTIKRMSKKFAAEDGLIEIFTDPAQAEAASRAFNDVYAQSWKKPEPYPAFVPGLIHWLAEKGQLRLGIARLAGTPIAAQLWTVNQGKAHIFKVAYDEAFSRLSPGTLLTARLMEHVIDRDAVHEVDYLIGDDPYKQSWMSHRQERWGIIAYNPRTLIGMALLIKETAERTLRKLSTLALSWLKQVRSHYHDRLAVRALGSNKMRRNATADEFTWSFFPATDFAAVAPRWQALCDATTRSPLLSADFVGTALRHFGRGDELVCIAKNASGPVAGAILQRKNSLLWQTFQPSQMPLGPWLQQPGADLAEVAQSLLRRLPFPALILAATQIDPNFCRRPDDRSAMTLDSITTGRTRLASDMDQFLNGGSVKENPKSLSELMRRMRKAEKDHGQICLEKETTAEAAAEFVNRYASTESRGWKGLAGTALSPDDEQAKFYAELMQRFARVGKARMYTLKFGDTPVARQIAVAGDDTLVLLKTTYEPEFRNYGPGVILIHHLTKDVHECEPAIRVLEMYGAVNDSQKLWISDTRVIYHANVYRFRFLALIHRRWTMAA